MKGKIYNKNRLKTLKKSNIGRLRTAIKLRMEKICVVNGPAPFEMPDESGLYRKKKNTGQTGMLIRPAFFI